MHFDNRPGEASGRKLQKWSDAEVKTAVEFFRANTKKCIVPNKKQYDECVAKFPILSARPWKNIKYYVKNQISKNSKLK
nr:unnamed protein product [Callosobruchus analis]